jgi:hypothetical protein
MGKDLAVKALDELGHCAIKRREFKVYQGK